MKSFRLLVHQKTFSEDDLVISQKDYPEASKNDIIEIYSPAPQEEDGSKRMETEDDYPRLLLQITSFKDELVQPRTISVEQSVVSAFGLKIYKDVVVRLVNPSDVALDSIELTFRDQYMGRSEMWRLKNNLVNSCVYMNKKLEFCMGTIRCQVYEMWSQGERVACGVITEETKIVFRSSTAMVYIFLQMSSEMWDFDIYGDLYFEKAVNGFLSDLFMKWKKNGSNHEVTIVLFSRTFYEASSLEEFPLHMRECLQKDYRGRFYEDFYRVPVQNERYDDWSNILVQLRKIFQDYLNVVLKYHARPNNVIPAATNSTAAQGNFLEVLNMSLNVFEKHYLDRSFDRTGQLSVVVTPGVGVFEVDRELTNITKQRIIDGGVGSDLVCVGEQPLHAVPLLKDISVITPQQVGAISLPKIKMMRLLVIFETRFERPYTSSLSHIAMLCVGSGFRISLVRMIQKSFPNYSYMFHNKDAHLNVPDDYSMPHWTNLSFYSINKKIPYSNFIPRIKLPPSLTNSDVKRNFNGITKRELLSEEDCIHSTFFDYDAYDAAVFQLPSAHHVQESSFLQSKPPSRYKRSSGSLLDSQEFTKGTRRKMSDPDISYHRCDRSQPIAIPSASTNPLTSPHTEDKEFSPPVRMVVGSEGSPPHESKALINPFDPSHVTIKLTSNRRRWTHIFPKGPTGVLIQQHHYQAVPAQGDAPNGAYYDLGERVLVRQRKSLVVTSTLQEYCKKRPSQNPGSGNSTSVRHSTKSLTFLWGATGEQEWTPALTTGVDWKSLTIPACLPITTDYFPDKRTLHTDYVVSLYQLAPDSVYADFAQSRGTYKRPLTTEEVFKELISQRLAQGFQLILMNPHRQYKNSSSHSGQPIRANILRKSPTEDDEMYYLSIGRLFHKISLSGTTISVTRYRPRHPYPGFKYQYRYRFHAPYHDTYEESYATFTTEKLEHYNWNYLDHYVCTGGDTTDFGLVDALKYWRFRVYILPLHPSDKESTKEIVEGSPRCDIYTLPTAADHAQMVDGFLKFIEAAVNKLKRSNNVSKKPRMSLSVQTLPPLAQPRRNSISSFTQNIGSSSPFRERLGSNRLSDRPRPRSGSKILERSRASQGSQDQPTESTDTEENLSASLTPLKSSCTSIELIEAIKHPLRGFSFINLSQNLPSFTFVSADAVSWLMTHMEGITTIEKGVQVMQGLHKEKLIRHASGDAKKSFVYGFCLFYVCTEKDEREAYLPYSDPDSFESEFLEVEIKPALNWGVPASSAGSTVSIRGESSEDGVMHFLRAEIDPDYGEVDVEDVIYKKLRLETDVLGKSDRVEWGHARYHTVFRPDQAYELIAEWLTSSGSIVGELLFGWHRKGQGCGLQLIPIPHDPLALPYSNKSDPLRGPIFVPLNVSALDRGNHIFKDFSEDTWRARMFLFQEAIIQRFGFLKCLVEPPNNQNPSREHQYIHATGTIFVLISSPKSERSRANSLKDRRPNTTSKYSLHADVVPSPHEAYITRHVSGKNKADYNNSRKMGFLWCWNHMISKKWRTNQGVDSNFQIKCLKDFKAFCNNSEDRLRSFWMECWDAKTFSPI